jgi:hypothetical protein
LRQSLIIQSREAAKQAQAYNRNYSSGNMPLHPSILLNKKR